MPAANPLVLTFNEIKPDSLSLVGGKAGNLGVLTRAGLPVPPGYCLTTEAYRRVVGRTLDDIADALDKAAGDLTELGELAQRARERVLAADVPEDIAAEVRRNAGGPVAVRSSATAEDLPHASFAGQQDTYLNVIGAEAVLDAVRRCWASLWTDRAVAYRAANGIDHRAVLLAVVVQEMVQSEVAGVMFTADPVTGTRGHTVIDAAPGLGESVVSGAVNPDHFVVDTASGAVLERRVGDKRTAVRSLPGGGTESVESDRAASPDGRRGGGPGAGDGTAHPTGDAAGEGGGAAGSGPQACLDDEAVRALAALGARVEAHYGAPQDTEWAIDAEGTLWLTQARAITTLYPIPVRRAPADGSVRAYFNINVAQGMFRPFTPMGIAAFRAITGGATRMARIPLPDVRDGAPVLTEGGGRLFMDFTGVLRSRPGRAVVPRALDIMEARSAVVMRGLFDDPRFSITQRSLLPLLRRVVPLALRNGVPFRAAMAVASPQRARRAAARFDAELAERLAAGPGPGATTAERLDFAERALSTRFGPIALRLLPNLGAAAAMLVLAQRLLGRHARPGEIATVLRGLPHNVTTEMDLALWDLATFLRDDPDSVAALRDSSAADLAERFHEATLPPAMTAGLAPFLERYGLRAVGEIDVGVPRWSEDPTHIIGVLANYLRSGDPALAPDVLFARGASEAEAVLAELSGRVGRVRGAAVRFALGRARALTGLRELPKFCFVRILGAARAQLLAVGAALVAQGRLERSEDVFFLDLAETRAALAGSDPRPLVAERRETYEREMRRRHIPRVVLSDGTEPEAVATALLPGDGALTGTPASSGTVSGTARVVLDPVGAHLEPGEILVCPSTDPGWTPLFLTAGGLVMEMGGANSHGAVVAREYGIPAVVGVAGATERITTGDAVTVDGTSGAVHLDADTESGSDTEVVAAAARVSDRSLPD